MLRLYLIIIFILTGLGGYSQLTGIIISTENQEPLIGANVYWAGTTSGTTTDAEGKFSLAYIELPAKLVVSFAGYTADTTSLQQYSKVPLKIVLTPGTDLDAFEVEGKRATTLISTMDPIAVEELNRGELSKAACCNLSESFNTNASVDVVEGDAVTGTKRIQLLGLDGVYVQFQIENLPVIRGLNTATGLSELPGTWIESLQISKGSGSVVNGHESMTGQINVELLKAEDNDNFYLNLYGNSLGRAEANLQYSQKVGEKWSTNLFVHGSGKRFNNDRNNDGFLDAHNYENVNLLSRWRRATERSRFMIMAKYVDHNRDIGQTQFDFARDFGTQNAYGIGLNTRQAELFVKTGVLFPEKPERGLGFLGKVNRYEIDSYFGNRTYTAIQNSGYFNSIYQNMIGSTLHTYRTGASFRYDFFDESLQDSAFKREEIVPGAFFEYTYNDAEKVSVVAGFRGDYHNLFGWNYAPRLHFKYNFKPLSAIRFSAGRGYRTSNAIAENIGLLASSRQLFITRSYLQEESWNYGVTVTHKFQAFERDAVLSSDVFRTTFENQLVIDLDQSARQLHFYNLDGTSFSHSWQTDLQIEPFKNFEMHLAYKWTEVQVQQAQGVLQKILVPKHRGLISLGYKTPKEIWQIDATTSIVGPSRLPSTADNLPEFQLADRSPVYFTQHIQVTKQFRKFELYGGVENLLDYRQNDPIIDPSNPFGEQFDTGLIWGPVAGRVVYLGLHYRIK